MHFVSREARSSYALKSLVCVRFDKCSLIQIFILLSSLAVISPAQTTTYVPMRPDNPLSLADPIGITPQPDSTGMYRTVVPSSGSLSAFFPALSLPQRSGWRLNLGYLHSSNTYSATQSVVVSPHAVLSSGKTFWIDSYSYTESLDNKFPGGLEINLPRLRASIEYAGDIKVFDARSFSVAWNRYSV